MKKNLPMNWHPISIEEWFKDFQDVCELWRFFDFVEEKRVPIYADEPWAKSRKFPKNKEVMKWNRSNFRPHENFDQLRTIAELTGMTTISVDITLAFREVVEWVKELNNEVSVS